MYSQVYPALEQLSKAVSTVHSRGFVLNKITPDSIVVRLLPNGDYTVMVSRPFESNLRWGCVTRGDCLIHPNGPLLWTDH
jgi:hypothetical protein